MGVTVPVTPAPRMGVYGGAFDPPHLAHVDMASAFIAQCALDRLLVLPTGQAWHKPTQPLSPMRHRVAMAQLAFGELPHTTVDTRETQRSGPSFTIDTLVSLQTEYPGAQWFLLMGADQWGRFATWHRWQDIASAATIVVADRPNHSGDELSKSLQNTSPTDTGTAHAVPLQWQPRPLSSTQVRTLVEGAAGQAHRAWPMVPPAVARYISQHQLYTSTTP